jgi:cytochrome P450
VVTGDRTGVMQLRPGVWIVDGLVEMNSLLLNTAGFSVCSQTDITDINNTDITDINNVEVSDASVWLPLTDPPLHTRLRRCISASLGQRSLESFELGIEGDVGRVINSVPRNVEFDPVEALGEPIASRVVCRLLGIPPKWASELARHGRVMSSVLDSKKGTSKRSVLSAKVHLEDIAERWLSNTSHSGGLVDDVRERARRGMCTQDEARWLCVVSVAASVSTLANALGAVAYELGHFRDVSIPSKQVGRLADELIRLVSPVAVGVVRVSKHDQELGGRSIRVSDRIIPNIRHANRDPRIFQDAASVQLDTPRVHRHLAFGAGIHRCPGALVATFTIQTFISALNSTSKIVSSPTVCTSLPLLVPVDSKSDPRRLIRFVG